MTIITKSDFTGQYNIPDRKGVYTQDTLQAYIDKYVPYYIRQLLGVELGNAIINYSGSGNSDYDYIINAFSYQSDLNFELILESFGIKEFLLAAVFYEYSHNALVNTQMGVINPNAETAVSASPFKTMRYAENKWNNALDTAYAIQQYCLLFPDKYPTFRGQAITVKYSNIL